MRLFPIAFTALFAPGPAVAAPPQCALPATPASATFPSTAGPVSREIPSNVHRPNAAGQRTWRALGLLPHLLGVSNYARPRPTCWG